MVEAKAQNFSLGINGHVTVLLHFPGDMTLHYSGRSQRALLWWLTYFFSLSRDISVQVCRMRLDQSTETIHVGHKLLERQNIFQNSTFFINDKQFTTWSTVQQEVIDIHLLYFSFRFVLIDGLVSHSDFHQYNLWWGRDFTLFNANKSRTVVLARVEPSEMQNGTVINVPSA